MKSPLLLALTALFMLLALGSMPFFGSQPLDWESVFAHSQGSETPDGIILFRLRLPRVLLAVITGGALALAGVVFQALLRNPLATPYTLGVATGSAFGALLMIKAGFYISVLGYTAVQLGAFTGSMVAILTVYTLSRRLRRLSIHTLILAGVTINFIFSAAILILHYLADFTETHQMIRWTIGGLDSVSYGLLGQSFAVVLVSGALFLVIARSLNLLSTSEDNAMSKGVPVHRVQLISFVTASLMTGSVVALSGPVGFVGLIIPHLLRMVGGPDHRYLVPASFCCGGGFLAVADTIARTVLAPIDLPVGIFTTLIGGPFFLWILTRRPQDSG